MGTFFLTWFHFPKTFHTSEHCPVLSAPAARNKLEDWSHDPFGAMLLEARGVDTVRASPLLHLLCQRLDVVFEQMAKY